MQVAFGGNIFELVAECGLTLNVYQRIVNTHESYSKH